MVAIPPSHCAEEVLETVPLIMRSIRCHMGSHLAPELSMAQFRALLFIQQHPDASLSATAEFLGLALPTSSKLIEALVSRDLVSRQTHPDDRRRVLLTLTPGGKAMLGAARQSAQECLARTLATCTDDDRAAVDLAMRILRAAFSAPSARRPEKSRASPTPVSTPRLAHVTS